MFSSVGLVWLCCELLWVLLGCYLMISLYWLLLLRLVIELLLVL